jgi:hypothetical protein
VTCTACEPVKGSIGFLLIVQFTDDRGRPLDLTTTFNAPVFTIRVMKPDLSTEDLAGAYSTDGTDGQVQGVTISSTLDAAGEYQIQGRVVDGSASLASELGTFTVSDSLF